MEVDYYDRCCRPLKVGKLSEEEPKFYPLRATGMGVYYCPQCGETLVENLVYSKGEFKQFSYYKCNGLHCNYEYID